MPGRSGQGQSSGGGGLVIVALLLIVGAAAALPEGLSVWDSDDSRRVIVPEIPALIRYLIAGIGGLMLVALILLRATVMGGPRPMRAKGRSRWRWVALILVAAALWATFAAWRQDDITRELTDGGVLPSPSPQTTATPEGSPERVTEYSESFGWVVGILFVLVLGAITVALFMLFRKERDMGATRQLEERILEELEAGLDDLHDIDDPRAAVIACYSRMERVVELGGIVPAASDTPFELLARVLRERRVSESSARRLTELFEEAKFSVRPIDEAMRGEALAAVLQVRDELVESARPGASEKTKAGT